MATMVGLRLRKDQAHGENYNTWFQLRKDCGDFREANINCRSVTKQKLESDMLHPYPQPQTTH